MNSQPLNGSDQLMRGFDFELRRRGFAGNHCQIVLGLTSKISPGLLQGRLTALQNQLPMLNARLGGMFKPRWNVRASSRPIPVQLHAATPNLTEKLFNQPLRLKQGELMRFDLVEHPDGRMDVVFAWAHTLMDATAAEHFLSAVSDEKIALPTTNPQPPGAPEKWPERLDLMKKSVA